MLKLKENGFANENKILYADDDGNTLQVNAKRDGSELRFKFTPKDEMLKIGRLKYEHPYNLDGVYYDIRWTTDADTDAEEFKKYKNEVAKPYLSETTRLIERWVTIANTLFMLSPDRFKAVSEVLEMSEEDKASSIQNIVASLSEYEEMEDWVNALMGTLGITLLRGER